MSAKHLNKLLVVMSLPSRVPVSCHNNAIYSTQHYTLHNLLNTATKQRCYNAVFNHHKHEIFIGVLSDQVVWLHVSTTRSLSLFGVGPA